MSKLPQDIIVDILTYLPVKSLLRFKSVCKPWRSLISDPQFAKLHLKRVKEQNSINHGRLLIATLPPYSVNYEAVSDGDYDNAVQMLHYPDAVNCSDFFHVDVLGSCNGLLCIVDVYDNLVLWNPSTRDSKKMPKPNSSLQYDLFSGLGYDPTLNDYKIVVIVSSGTANSSKETKFEVLTLKTNRWRRIEGLHSCIALVGHHQGVFWNGALHWLGQQENGPTKMDVVVSFDIAEEKFKEVVPLPCQFEEWNLGISGNCLCIFGDGNESYSETWAMRECDNSFRTRLFSVPKDRLARDYKKEMCLTKKDEVVIDRSGFPIELHRPIEEASKFVMIQHDSDPFFESASYLESLVAVNDDDDPDAREEKCGM